MELMTPEEHHAIEISATLWNYIVENVVGDGESSAADLREIVFHIHGVQRAIMGQAAARAYPDQYRLLGGVLEDRETPAKIIVRHYIRLADGTPICQKGGSLGWYVLEKNIHATTGCDECKGVIASLTP